MSAVYLGAVDVHYPATGGAWAAAVVAVDCRFAVVVQECRRWLPQVAPYEPGRFFARELPAIRAVLTETGQLDVVLVDGYVDLDPAGGSFERSNGPAPRSVTPP